VVKDVYFEVETPLGVAIRTTKEYWEIIISAKHPSVKRFEGEVEKTLENPDQIRKSKQDPRVHLYDKSISRLFMCIVADHINNKEGLL
jgi:hypothetical protein